MHQKREKIQIAKLVPKSEYWTVQISAVTFGANRVMNDFKALNKGGVIIDSGSTDTVLPLAVKTFLTDVSVSPQSKMTF